MGLGVRVKTLNHLHAKVWISGDDVIIGSANASKSGLPRNNDSGTGGNIEAAVLSRDASLSSELQGWFDNQWQASAAITEDDLAEAARLWQRRSRADRRAFARTLMEKVRTPEPSDRFSGLRLVAYLAGGWSSEAEQFLKDKARTHYSGQEWADLKGEAPFYEWPGPYPEWTPGAQTALMDFSCARKGGRFTCNGFWAVHDCPFVPLTESRLTLLTRLPDFNGHSSSKGEETELAERIQRFVADRGFHTDAFDFYIDMDFVDFCEAERAMLKSRLVAQVVETAKELCRTGRFDSALTLNAIRLCTQDRDWLRDYSRFVDAGIYDNRNPLKRQINPDFGKKIRLSVGATRVTAGNGKPVREKVTDEIIQWYTPFKNFNATTVMTR